MTVCKLDTTAGRDAGAAPPYRESTPKRVQPPELTPPRGNHLEVRSTRFHLHATNWLGASDGGALYPGFFVSLFSHFERSTAATSENALVNSGLSRGAASIRPLWPLAVADLISRVRP